MFRFLAEFGYRYLCVREDSIVPGTRCEEDLTAGRDLSSIPPSQACLLMRPVCRGDAREESLCRIRLGSFLKKRLFGGQRNLVSLDEPYDVMARLLKRSAVTGHPRRRRQQRTHLRQASGRFPDATAYAFEPNPLYTQTLQELRPSRSAVSPAVRRRSRIGSGRDRLHIMESPGATSLLKPADRLKDVVPAGAAIKAVSEVDLVTLDEWAGRNGNPSIELMKFDIQGAELQALRGAARMLRESTLLVYTEIWFNAVYDGCALVRRDRRVPAPQGFALYDMYKPKYDPHGLLVWADAIFLNLERVPW